MNETKFKACIGLLSKYYNASPNDTQYRLIWDSMKKYSDDSFEKICREIVKIFNPTSTVPFPMVHNFIDARLTVDLIGYDIPQYKRIEHTEVLASKEEIQTLCNEVYNKIGRPIPQAVGGAK